MLGSAQWQALLFPGPSGPTAGKLFSWGYNRNGEMGIGVAGEYGSPYYNFSSPIQVGTLATWTGMYNGYKQAFAKRTNGTLWAWGRNANYGQLGLGDRVNRSSPTQVGALTTWGRVSSGSNAGSTGLIGGKGYHWGQILTPIQAYVSSPVQIGALTDWTDLETHAQFFHAIRGGKLYSWGENDWGNLGLGYTGPVISAITQVGALTNWKRLCKGLGVFSHFLKTDYSLWACGKAGQGQLGDNTHVNYQDSPVQVAGGHTWSRNIIGGSYHALGIDSAGHLWAWGGNFFGQLGIGSNGLATYKSSPVQVGSDTWISVAAGQNFSLGVKSNGTLWSWGKNVYGRLGLGDTNNRSSPTQIGSGTTWVSCFSTEYTGFAIRTT